MAMQFLKKGQTVARTTSTGRAYQQFWARLMEQIRERHLGWVTPGSPPPRNSLPLSAGTSWFSYGMSFGHQGLCSELFIRVPGDAPAGQRILRYLESRSAQLESAYGGSLQYEYLSQALPGRIACRLADYCAGSIRETSEHESYLGWFLDSQARLRHAIEVIGGLSSVRQHSSQR
jgi:hypothetical protein